MRPAVANDGGDITFRGFKDGIVYLDMKGACSGCPSSTATLRHGIQNLLRALPARRRRSPADGMNRSAPSKAKWRQSQQRKPDFGVYCVVRRHG